MKGIKPIKRGIDIKLRKGVERFMIVCISEFGKESIYNSGYRFYTSTSKFSLPIDSLYGMIKRLEQLHLKYKIIEHYERDISS